MRLIQLAEDEDPQLWNAYVDPRAAAATDLSAWRRVVRAAYEMPSYALAALNDGRIVGTLSLFEVKHPLFGHYLTTAPFGNDGGLHCDNDAARDALLAEARTLADRLDVDYLLIRTRQLELYQYVVDRHYRTAVIDLHGGADVVWKSRLPSKTRNQIRRGMKEGFSIEFGHNQMRPFQDVFHTHMRDLGSPAHSGRFYSAIAKHFAGQVEFVVVRDGSDLAAGALLFWINDTAINYHTVSLRKYNHRCPNYLIYWTMIEASCKRGCGWFDMGRSEADSSSLRFKSNWGPQILTLHYNYYLRKLKHPPYLDPRNPRYRIPTTIWRRLPVFATRALGPRLISGLA